MFNPAIIIYERASFARDIEYLRNIVEDAVTMESLNTLDRYGKGVSGIFETDHSTMLWNDSSIHILLRILDLCFHEIL